MNQLATIATSRWRAIAVGLAGILIGLVVWDGADRRAADATQILPQGSSAAEWRSETRTLKLASFNIHSGKGTDGKLSLPRVAELLGDYDVVGLYEVRGTADSNQAATLAALVQAAWLFAPTERQWWADHFGNALLHRLPVKTAVRIPLINTRGKAFRNAVLSIASLQTADVRILSVHVDRERDRRSQLQTVIELFLNLKPPCVLMGDLNTTADDPLLVKLLEQPDVQSPLHNTLGSALPSQNIDWIFTRGFQTRSAKLVENAASDHPLLQAELEPTQ